MGEQQRLPRSRHVDECSEVIDQVFDRVLADALGLVCLAESAQVWCPSAVAERCKERQLMSPAVSDLRESVEAECESVTHATGVRMEIETVGLDPLRPNGCVRSSRLPGVGSEGPIVSRMAAGGCERPSGCDWGGNEALGLPDGSVPPVLAAPWIAVRGALRALCRTLGDREVG